MAQFCQDSFKFGYHFIETHKDLKDCLIHFGEDTAAKVDKTILCKGTATADEELECLSQTIEEYGKIQYLSNYFEKDLNGTK